MRRTKRVAGESSEVFSPRVEAMRARYWSGRDIYSGEPLEEIMEEVGERLLTNDEYEDTMEDDAEQIAA